jgi:hypothetical protein
MTRRMVLAGVVMGVVLFAGRIAPVGRAWDEERQCGKAGDGNVALTPNLRWATRDPQYVTMSRVTARKIARQVGPYEFSPPDSHPPAKYVPCNVASSVAFQAAKGWSVQERFRFSVSAGWTGYSVGPPYRFACVVTTRSRRKVGMTCVHNANSHAGAISVRFVATRPANPG